MENNFPFYLFFWEICEALDTHKLCLDALYCREDRGRRMGKFPGYPIDVASFAYKNNDALWNASSYQICI